MKRYKAITPDGKAFEFDAIGDHYAILEARAWTRHIADLIDISTPNHRAVDLTTPQVQPKQ